MAAHLDAFLEDAAGRQMIWGDRDCSLYPADWILILTGIDPAIRWRGQYASQEGAEAFVRAEGGLLPTFVRAAQTASLRRTRAPSGGAVGIVRADCLGGVMGAVCVGPGFWSTVAPTGGIVVTACRALFAWEVPAYAPSRPIPDRRR